MVLAGMRYFLGLIKSSERNQPLKLALLPVGLKSSIVSVGGGKSVRVSASLITTGTIAGGLGSALPGEPPTCPLGRQLLLESQASGSAFSSTMANEKPSPSVMGYQELL